MAKSALDLFKQAYKQPKGTSKQTQPMKVRALKAQNIKDSKVLSPLVDDADSLMTEEYEKAHPGPHWISRGGSARKATKQTK